MSLFITNTSLFLLWKKIKSVISCTLHKTALVTPGRVCVISHYKFVYNVFTLRFRYFYFSKKHTELFIRRVSRVNSIKKHCPNITRQIYNAISNGKTLIWSQYCRISFTSLYFDEEPGVVVGFTVRKILNRIWAFTTNRVRVYARQVLWATSKIRFEYYSFVLCQCFFRKLIRGESIDSRKPVSDRTYRPI